MKLTGEYYGDVSMDQALETDSRVFPRFFCAVVLLGQWFVVIQALTSVFYEGLAQMKMFYFLLIVIIWYLQTAACNTICLYVLPRGQKETSRLGQLFSNLLSVKSHFSGMKMYKINLAIAIVCAFVTLNTSFIVVLDCYGNSSVARFRPWNGLFAYRLIHFIFCALDGFAWALPFSLFYVSCEILVQIFESLEKKIRTESPDVLTIEALRKDHRKFCETVALADKVFSPLVFVIVILDVPLMCINFHQLVKSPLSGDGNVIYIVSVLYWGIAVTGQLAFIMRCGVKVNDKIHGFYDTLQNISVADNKEHLELLHFLMHLRGEPIGLSVGGLVVINKSLVLSLVGIIISYFAVLVTLPG
ncbi:uncharacterized protein LOC144656748 isoform X1 [Oculina patagonica]